MLVISGELDFLKNVDLKAQFYKASILDINSKLSYCFSFACPC